jgi:hypothetical protein
MVIEIAANGDVRGTVGPQGHGFITRHGQGYFVETGATGPIVSRAGDVAAAMSEKMARLDPAFRKQVGDHPPMLRLLRKGSATVNGRTGDAYYVLDAKGVPAPAPTIVISHDPALAPLSRAMAGQFAMSMQGLSRTMSTASFGAVTAALRSGAPIVFTGAQLQTVSTRPIPASEFVLPTAPLTPAQVRQRIMATPPVRPAPPVPPRR